MQKLNGLGVELQSLKQEMLKQDYPEIVKKALRESAENMVKNETIDVDLHLALTDEDISSESFTSLLHETESCMKTKEEMLVEFDIIRKKMQEQLDDDNIPTGITSQSMVEKDELVFTKTFKLDKQWVSEYFGQPPEEVDKLMVRNGFIEKFAVLRLSKILESFLESEQFTKVNGDVVDCKGTRVFYDLENDYYGIHLMFYLDIEDAEVDEKATEALNYIRQVSDKADSYINQRMKV